MYISSFIKDRIERSDRATDSNILLAKVNNLNGGSNGSYKLAKDDQSPNQ